VILVEFHREGMDGPASEADVELTLVTPDEEHCRRQPAATAVGLHGRVAEVTVWPGRWRAPAASGSSYYGFRFAQCTNAGNVLPSIVGKGFSVKDTPGASSATST